VLNVRVETSDTDGCRIHVPNVERNEVKQSLNLHELNSI